MNWSSLGEKRSKDEREETEHLRGNIKIENPLHSGICISLMGGPFETGKKKKSYQSRLFREPFVGGSGGGGVGDSGWGGASHRVQKKKSKKILGKLRFGQCQEVVQGGGGKTGGCEDCGFKRIPVRGWQK